MTEYCEVCGLPVPRPEGEPPPTTPLLPGQIDVCLLDHQLTWWQRWRRRRTQRRLELAYRAAVAANPHGAVILHDVSADPNVLPPSAAIRAPSDNEGRGHPPRERKR